MSESPLREAVAHAVRHIRGVGSELMPIEMLDRILEQYPGEPMEPNPELTEDERDHIDDMPLYDMLYKWRFAPTGTFQRNDPWSDYFIQVMYAKRDANPAGWTAASKAMGW